MKYSINGKIAGKNIKVHPILLIICAFFIYLEIWCLLDSSFDKEDLIEETGDIIDYSWVEGKSGVARFNELLLKMENDKEFLVENKYKNHYDEIISIIGSDQKVKLFHKSDAQHIWTYFTKKNNIYHLEINNHVIVDIKEFQSVSKRLAYLFFIPAILSIACFFICIILITKKITNNNLVDKE